MSKGLLILDCYDTLIKFNKPANAYPRMFRRLGLDSKDFYLECLISKLDWKELGASNEQIAEFKADLREDIASISVLPWTESLLKSPHQICILSNLAEGYDLPIKQLFPEIPLFTSYELGLRKPSVEIFQHVLDYFQVPAKNSILIDDKPANIIMATRLGINAQILNPHDEDSLKRIINLTASPIP